jgi:Ca2+:H+ antiporter
VSIQALVKGEILIVKTSLIGSMLSNLLLVLGMSFFFGGLQRIEQHFNVVVAQTAASLLALSIGSLIVPTVFRDWTPDADQVGLQNKTEDLSRGTSIILLLVYGSYLFFQLKSHRAMYNAPSPKTEKRKSSRHVEEGSAIRSLAQGGAIAGAASGGQVNAQNNVQEQDDEEEEEEEPRLTPIGAIITLGLSTTLIAFCSEFMVSSINDIPISKTFIGLILLPIVGNAAEHATSVTVAIKDKMDLAIGVAVGSSMQIALLVLPLIDVLGWITESADCHGNNMSLSFDGFQLAVLFVAVLLVNYLIQDGKSRKCNVMVAFDLY